MFCACCVRDRERGALRFLDVEAGVSGAESGGSDGDGGDAADADDLGSLADFIADPSPSELEQAGLVFHSSDDEGDPTALLRERRPFARFRAMHEGSHSPPAAAAAAAALSSGRRVREPKPAAPVLGAASLAAGDGAGIAALAASGAEPQFLHMVSGCSWLPDVSLLHDEKKSAELYAGILQGYAYEKMVRRQAKPPAALQPPGQLELTAAVNYCAHILSARLGVLWAGGAPAPGEKAVGSLMRPLSASNNVFCEALTLHGEPLDLTQALLTLVLGHPLNHRWRDLVVGRKLYRHTELTYLVQLQVRLPRMPSCFRLASHLPPLTRCVIRVVCVAFCVWCTCVHLCCACSCPCTVATGLWWRIRTACSTSRLASCGPSPTSTPRRMATAASA